MRRKEAVYAVYDGDTFKYVGMVDEVARFLGVKPSTVYSLADRRRREAAEKIGGRYAIRVDL